MTLEEFIKEESKRLKNFEWWWIRMNAKHPEMFPMEFPDDNTGIWSEMLLTYEEDGNEV